MERTQNGGLGELRRAPEKDHIFHHQPDQHRQERCMDLYPHKPTITGSRYENLAVTKRPRAARPEIHSSSPNRMRTPVIWKQSGMVSQTSRKEVQGEWGRESIHRKKYRAAMENGKKQIKNRRILSFTMSMLEKILKGMDGNKAGGHDDIQTQFLQNQSQLAKENLFNLINRTYKQGRPPAASRVSEVVEVVKHGKPGEFCPINFKLMGQNSLGSIPSVKLHY